MKAGRAGCLELAQLLFDLVVEVWIAIIRLSAFSGRAVYAAIGITPSQEIMFLTGLGLWSTIGAIAYWAWLL